MASALDPNRLATLEHRLDVRLAARRDERARREDAAKQGWRTRRADRRDPILSTAGNP